MEQITLHKHKHYLGAAHSFEIVDNYEPKDGEAIRPDVTILKTFFINDKVNVNDWQATWEGLKEDAAELPGVPLVLQEDLQHPKFSVQEMFDRGTIFDYDIDEEKKQIIVYVRITDHSIIDRIKSGELQYVSPAVIPRGDETLEKRNGVDILHRTLPIHLAIVGNPAYGTDAAKMTHLCSGNGVKCYDRLKMMTAAKAIYESSDDCVSKKIQIIKREKPSISNDQAAAIAYSYCRGGKKADFIDSITQTPYIKRLIASMVRIGSMIEKEQTGHPYYMRNGIMGNWINAKKMDVFVAAYQSIDEAIKEQCDCSNLSIQ